MFLKSFSKTAWKNYKRVNTFTRRDNSLAFLFAKITKRSQNTSMTFPTKIYLFVNDCYSKVISEEDIDIKDSFIKHIDNNEENALKYVSALLEVVDSIKKDLDFFFESDPAANSLDEIKVAYPGFLAIVYHRIAHPLYTLGYRVESRFISEQAHKIT